MREIDWDEPIEYVMDSGYIREAKFVGHLNDRYVVGVFNGASWYVVNVQANGYWGGDGHGNYVRNIQPKPHVEETTVYLYRTTAGFWYTSMAEGRAALGSVKVKITEGEFK